MQDFESYKEMFAGFDKVERELGHFPAFIDGIIANVTLKNNMLTVDIALFEDEKIARITLTDAHIITLNVDTASPKLDKNYISNIAITTEENKLHFILTGDDFAEILRATFEDASISLLDDTDRNTRRFMNSVYNNLIKYNKP